MVKYVGSGEGEKLAADRQPDRQTDSAEVTDCETGQKRSHFLKWVWEGELKKLRDVQTDREGYTVGREREEGKKKRGSVRGMWHIQVTAM